MAPDAATRTSSWLTHDRRVLLMALGAGLPGALVSLLLLWTGDYSDRLRWTLALFVIVIGITLIQFRTSGRRVNYGA